MEMVYQMVSRTDPETMRFLNDVIFLYVLANPDGQELVANWYMRGEKPIRLKTAVSQHGCCRGSRRSTSATTTIAISTCRT